MLTGGETVATLGKKRRWQLASQNVGRVCISICVCVCVCIVEPVCDWTINKLITELFSSSITKGQLPAIK